MERKKQLSTELWVRFEKEVKREFKTKDKNDFDLYIEEMNAIDLFYELPRFGYDFWFEKTGISEFDSEKIRLMNKRDIISFIEFLEEEICSSSNYIMEYKPENWRL